ncbi:late embryogenesis abundant protein D-34-like [Phragmites australis]|uniref:late embryogenesis abundant protein D-34-like n=1 Tax=Phragmites australis TaxID=29695 RepID=UPI002D76CC45|nr:late embryogenesis abundant protein D-34-like [Phragmites australis]
MSQAQPVRGGDVYPPSAADDQEARRERDKIIGQRQQQHDGGLQVTETDLPAGRCMVTASAGGQVMSQLTVPVPDRKVAEATDAVTVGEALQAVALTSAGDKPVDFTDASAVQAAEIRATGLGGNIPGGVAAAAQQAAETNMKLEARCEDCKVRLRDVVGKAAAVLPANKVATREDAEKVAAATKRNAGRGCAGSGKAGVAEAVAEAAAMNEGRMM